MSSPWIGMALRAIPWDTLLKQAPAILNAASSLVAKSDTLKRHSKAPTDETAFRPGDVRQRLESLEEHDRSNAEVVKQIADQLEAVTESLEVVSARVRMALLVAGLTLVIALIAVGIAVFR